jgi:pimeloyl-ACP methyl ester carboxylesterase
MKDRFRVVGPSWLQCRARVSSSAVFFVHGLGGNNTSEYWGNIPDFLERDSRLSTVDFNYWRYPTHKVLSPSILEFIRRRALPGINILAANLTTDLQTISAEQNYDQVVVVGHSMGGLIAFRSIAARRDNENPTINQVATLGSPFKAPRAARLLAFLQFWSNRQILDLSNDPALTGLMVSGLKACRQFNIGSTYISSAEDAVVAESPLYELFDQKLTVAGEHTWMSSVTNINDLSYRTLVQFLLKATQKKK